MKARICSSYDKLKLYQTDKFVKNLHFLCVHNTAVIKVCVEINMKKWLQQKLAETTAVCKLPLSNVYLPLSTVVHRIYLLLKTSA